MRTIVIGDIHGGLKALEQLIERAGITGSDHLIFLGDYVDGWSEAAETVNFLIGLKANQKCTLLRGNHDELCYEWLITQEARAQWLQHGGQASKESYERADPDVWKIHQQFYTDLENYHIDAENRLFIHAGFTNLHGVTQEYFSKNYYWDRTLWETALAVDPAMTSDDPFYPKRLQKYSEIYIGHTPVTRIGKTTPFRAANVWNVDTGAAFRGPLSAMDVKTGELWQSDPVHLFYPDERGRN